MVDEDDDEHGGRKAEGTKRLARVLRIAALLTSQPRQWSRAALAGRLEVDNRTIDRDLLMLRDLGYETQRQGGGYAFVRQPPLPEVRFSLPEALALTLAAGLAREGGDIDTASLGAALAQLEALMPVRARSVIRQEVLQHSTSVHADKRRAVALETVQHAWLERRCVRIAYATASRGGAVSERVIEPYAVYPYERSWMVTALDHQREEVRIFKVDRILSATVLDQVYEIPATFDAVQYRGSAWGILRGAASEAVEIVLRFDADGGRWAQEERRDERMVFEKQADGYVIARLTAGITLEFVRWILWWGPHCRVELPAALRERVREMAKLTSKQYEVSEQ